MNTFVTDEEAKSWPWVRSGPYAGRRIERFVSKDKYPDGTYFVKLMALSASCGCGQWDCLDQQGTFVNINMKDVE